MTKEQLERLRRHAELLVQHCQMNAPDLCLELCVANLFASAAGYLGPRLWLRLGETVDGHLRNRVSLCATCGQVISPADSHPHECPRCVHKHDQEAAEIQAEMDGCDDADPADPA